MWLPDVLRLRHGNTPFVSVRIMVGSDCISTAASRGQPLLQPVTDQRNDEKRSEDDQLDVARDVHEVHPVAENDDEADSYHRSGEPPFAPEERDAAQGAGGNRLKGVLRADVGLSCRCPRREHDSRQGGEKGAEGEQIDEVPANRYAGKPGSILVSSDRIGIATEARPVEQDVEQDEQPEREPDRYWNAQPVVDAECENKVVRQADNRRATR